VWEAGTVVVRDICRPKGPKNPEVLRRERSPSKAIVMRSLEEVLLIDEAPRPTNQPTNEVHRLLSQFCTHGSVFFSLRNNYIFALRSSSSTAMAAALASTSSVASAATCFVQKSFPSSCSQRSVARPVVGKHSSLIFLLHCQVPVLPHLPDLPPATGSSTSSGRP
jgi:hypothetical protein